MINMWGIRDDDEVAHLRGAWCSIHPKPLPSSGPIQEKRRTQISAAGLPRSRSISIPNWFKTIDHRTSRQVPYQSAGRRAGDHWVERTCRSRSGRAHSPGSAERITRPAACGHRMTLEVSCGRTMRRPSEWRDKMNSFRTVRFTSPARCAQGAFRQSYSIDLLLRVGQVNCCIAEASEVGARACAWTVSSGPNRATDHATRFVSSLI